MQRNTDLDRPDYSSPTPRLGSSARPLCGYGTCRTSRRTACRPERGAGRPTLRGVHPQDLVQCFYGPPHEVHHHVRGLRHLRETSSSAGTISASRVVRTDAQWDFVRLDTHSPSFRLGEKNRCNPRAVVSRLNRGHTPSARWRSRPTLSDPTSRRGFNRAVHVHVYGDIRFESSLVVSPEDHPKGGRAKVRFRIIFDGRTPSCIGIRAPSLSRIAASSAPTEPSRSPASSKSPSPTSKTPSLTKSNTATDSKVSTFPKSRPKSQKNFGNV
jgi:hypothetical protein